MRSVLFILVFLLGGHLAGAQVLLPDSQHASSCSYVKDILISGQRKTKDALILREIGIKPGDCVANDQLPMLAGQSKLRLLNLRLFTDVKVEWLAIAADTYCLNIVLLDRFPIMPDPNLEFADRNFNVWWNEMGRDPRRLNLGITLTHNNFRGNREQLGATGQVGYTQKLGISYARPFADKNQRHGFGISFYGLQNREIPYMTYANKLRFLRSSDNFMLRRIDAAIWYTYRPAYATTHELRLAYHHYWISDTIALLNPTYLGNDGLTQQDVLHFTYRFEYNGVDNWNYPLRGKRFIGTFDQKLALAGGYGQTSLYLHHDRYWHLGGKWYAAGIARGRVSAGQHQPYIFRQNLGYEFDYIRGYEYYAIDGSAFGILRLNLKRELLHWRIKLPVRYFEIVPIRVYAKVYADAGAGYNKYPIADAYCNKLLYAGGVGIDVVTLYDIKVRIEYTVNHVGEKGLYLHRNGE
ncbi:MAG: hypothetical protein QM642_12025 [Edaphocola sp.]